MKQRLILIITLLICSIQITFAQTADEIIKKTLEVQGNDKLKQFKSLKLSGRLTSMENSAQFKIIFKYPNSIRSEMSYNNMTLIQAFDGTNGWYIDPNDKDKKVQKMPDNMLGDLRNQTNLLESPFSDYEKKGIKIKLMGKKKTDGKDCFKLKLTLKDKSELYAFIDANKYILNKTLVDLKKDGKKAKVETYMKNYKSVGGVMLPHLIETFLDSKKLSSMIMDKVEANSNIDESVFKMPSK